MAKWIFTPHNTIAAAKTAVELIDNTVEIQVFGFKEGALQKIIVIQKT